MDRRLDAHRARLAQPVSQLEFVSIISETIADIHDGHARLELDSLTANRLADARVLPLRVALENDRVVVRFNDSPTDTSVRPGMEVISINGRSTESIIRALLPKIPRDGFVETGRRVRIAAGFPQLYWLFIEQTDTYSIITSDALGHQTRATLAGITERERQSIGNPVNAVLVSNLARLDAPPGNVSVAIFR